MKIEFLGQGYRVERDRPLGIYLIKFLESNAFHSFTAISAFASRGAIHGLKKYIEVAKNSFRNISIIVGVDQNGTSKEALEAILELDVRSFVFTQREHPIFHPKIYLFEGDEKAALIIGSSNLTLKGLWQNVEASILFEIESHNEKENIIEDVKDYFSGLFDFSDPNLIPLTTKSISQLVQFNKVPGEAERKKLHDEKGRLAFSSEAGKEILESLIPQRPINRLPKEFFEAIKSIKKPQPEQIGAKLDEPLEVPEYKGVLVWKRRSLPVSSVQMAGTGTNPTGGLRMVQDKFEINGKVIDQTTYFRQLFSEYDWVTIGTNPFREMAKVNFHVTVLGEYLGEFELEVRHKPSGEAEQGNYTTSISWRELSETIRNAKLVNLSLFIYAPKNDDDSFFIEII